MSLTDEMPTFLEPLESDSAREYSLRVNKENILKAIESYPETEKGLAFVQRKHQEGSDNLQMAEFKWNEKRKSIMDLELQLESLDAVDAPVVETQPRIRDISPLPERAKKYFSSPENKPYFIDEGKIEQSLFLDPDSTPGKVAIFQLAEFVLMSGGALNIIERDGVHFLQANVFDSVAKSNPLLKGRVGLDEIRLGRDTYDLLRSGQVDVATQIKYPKVAEGLDMLR